MKFLRRLTAYSRSEIARQHHECNCQLPGPGSVQSGIDLALAAFAFASQLANLERFELAAQIRRSGVSVPSNVAEGQANGPGKRYRNHVRIALGSLAELDTQVEIARRRQLVPTEDFKQIEKLIERTGKLIHGLERSLRRRQHFQIGCFVLLACCTAAFLFI